MHTCARARLALAHVKRVEEGKGTLEDLDQLNRVADNIQADHLRAGRCRCHASAAFLKHFRHEFEHHITHGRCMVPDYL